MDVTNGRLYLEYKLHFCHMIYIKGEKNELVVDPELDHIILIFHRLLDGINL